MDEEEKLIKTLKVEDAEVDELCAIRVDVDTEEELKEAVRKVEIIDVEMPCGNKFELSIEELKKKILNKEDVPCPCGNSTHWILKVNVGQGE